MKKILSLILAIMMIATLALSVSADEVEIVTKKVAGATDGNASWAGNDKEFTVTKKYFAVSYTMKAALKAGVDADNGCCGLTFGDGDPDVDDNAIFIPYDHGDGTNRILGCWWGDTNHPYVRFGPWWSNPSFGAEASYEIADLADKDVTILVLGQTNDDGTATITAYVNGTQVKVWGNQDEATGAFDGNIGWAIRLNNTEATLKFAESDKALDKNVFDAEDTPAAPKTGEATAVVALVSVLALAGAVVASKKRV